MNEFWEHVWCTVKKANIRLTSSTAQFGHSCYYNSEKKTQNINKVTLWSDVVKTKDKAGKK